MVFPDLDTVYAGAYLSGLYRTTDSGQSWTQLAAGLDSSGSYTTMARLGSTLFLGADEFSPAPILKSTDEGLTWPRP